MYSLCQYWPDARTNNFLVRRKENWYTGFGGLFCVWVLFSNEFKEEKLKVLNCFICRWLGWHACSILRITNDQILNIFLDIFIICNWSLIVVFYCCSGVFCVGFVVVAFFFFFLFLSRTRSQEYIWCGVDLITGRMEGDGCWWTRKHILI